jgi:hypothetical protein
MKRNNLKNFFTAITFLTVALVFATGVFCEAMATNTCWDEPWITWCYCDEGNIACRGLLGSQGSLFEAHNDFHSPYGLATSYWGWDGTPNGTSIKSSKIRLHINMGARPSTITIYDWVTGKKYGTYPAKFKYIKTEDVCLDKLQNGCHSGHAMAQEFNWAAYDLTVDGKVIPITFYAQRVVNGNTWVPLYSVTALGVTTWETQQQ